MKSQKPSTPVERLIEEEAGQDAKTSPVERLIEEEAGQDAKTSPVERLITGMLTVQMPDGQSFELPHEIASRDEMLREALRDAYPDAATATFDRKTVGVVKVVKKAGEKGGVLDVLEATPAHVNPALAMRWTIAPLMAQPDVSQCLLGMRPQIEAAVEAGRTECRTVQQAAKVLADAEPLAARRVPEGF